MIHVLLLQIKLGLISRKVTAGQKRLQDQSGLHPKLSDSQTCVPAKSGCQEKRIASQNQLPTKVGYQSRMDASQKDKTKMAVILN